MNNFKLISKIRGRYYNITKKPAAFVEEMLKDTEKHELKRIYKLEREDFLSEIEKNI